MKSSRALTPAVDKVRPVEQLARARALEECLEAMDRGETDLDKLSGRYPQARDEIRPLLEIAKHLGRQRGLSVPLSLEFREELRGLLSHHGTA